VNADAERLRQIIDNLIGNAIQHTPAGTPAAVSVRGEPAGSGLLTVADQGPGMTREQASHVFERFYRTDDARTRARGGAGLGLAIAASLATAHGGELTVDTEPGHGAAFHLRLPQAENFLSSPNLGVPLRHVCGKFGGKSALRNPLACSPFPSTETPAWPGITEINSPGD
jgi:signal transduction histidine kinase